MTSPVVPVCACGTPAAAPDARFCSACGRSFAPQSCPSCGTTVALTARFCHRCGAAVRGAAEGAAPAGAAVTAASRTPVSTVPGVAPARPAAPRAARDGNTPWLIAGAVIVALVGTILYNIWQGPAEPTAPGAGQMANAGNAGAQGAGAPGGAPPFAGGAPGGAPPSAGGVPVGRAPDISTMSPKERFQRLFNRIAAAAESGDSATAKNFVPMGLGAYSQLDVIDADARYDAAILYLIAGEPGAARLLADTILATQPNHLFGYAVQAEVARATKDAALRQRALAGLRTHWAAQQARNLPEYRDRARILETLKQEADAR